MPRIHRFELRLTEQEKQKAIALSQERRITLSELFRSVLYKSIPYAPETRDIQALLLLGELNQLLQQIATDDPKNSHLLQSLQNLLTDKQISTDN